MTETPTERNPRLNAARPDATVNGSAEDEYYRQLAEEHDAAKPNTSSAGTNTSTTTSGDNRAGSTMGGVRVLNGFADISRVPPLNWWVKPSRIPKDGIGIMYGPSGTGKSAIAISLALSMSCGRSWFNCHTKTAPTLFLAAEGEHGIAQRYKAWFQEHGTHEGEYHVIPHAWNFSDYKQVCNLIGILQKHFKIAPGLIVIDTLQQTCGGVNKNSELGPYMNNVRTLQTAFPGSTVLIVDHTGKDGERGIKGDNTKIDNSDFVIRVRPDSAGRGTLEWEKQKDGALAKSISYSLKPVFYGEYDEDGDPVEPIIAELQQSFMDGSAPHTAPQPQGDSSKSDLVEHCISQAGSEGITWTELGRQTGIGAPSTLSKALNKLKDKRLVEKVDGRYYLVVKD